MRIVSEGASQWSFHDTDTTWLQPLVVEVLALHPQANVAAFKPRVVEQLVEVRGEALQLHDGLAALARRVGRWKLDKGVARLRNSSFSEANMLRRALMTRVPVAALDACTVFENTTATPSEIIAHRLGQLALVGAPRVELDLKDRDVYFAGDLRCTDGGVAEQDHGMSLAEGGGRLHLQATSAIGTVHGRGHSKFAAVAAVGFFPHYVLPTLTPVGRGALLAAGVEVRRRPARKGWFAPVGTQRAFLEEVLLKVGEEPSFASPTDFDVCVDSLGQLPPEQCLALAAKALLEEMSLFDALLTESPSISWPGSQTSSRGDSGSFWRASARQDPAR